MLRAVADDFPRAVTADVLDSKRVQWSHLSGGPEKGVPPGVAEPWSRRAGVLGGLEEWRETLSRWAATARTAGLTAEECEAVLESARSREEMASRIARGLEALRAALDPDAGRTWAEHAQAVSDLWNAALVVRSGSRGARKLAEILDAMRMLGELPGRGGPVAFAAMVSWLERAVASSSVRAHAADAGGLRALDFKQARGLTFRRLFVLGMQDDLFPSRARPDAFLDDDARARLRESTGRPIPVPSESEHEERLLLTLVLGSARESLHVSWQRADRGGRSKTPSMALREVARVTLGRPELRAVVDQARDLPTSPHGWIDRIAQRPGLVAPSEATLATAFACRRPGEALERLGKTHPELRPGLEMLCETESFVPHACAYDGIARPARPESMRLSVSALETLGRCPLQFFFRQRLGIRGLDDVAGAWELSAKDAGLGIHRLLEELYRRLRDEGLLPGGGSRLRRRAKELLPEAWDEAMAETTGPRAKRLPVLWRAHRRQWLASLDRFVREDLGRLAEEGCESVDLEHEVGGRLDLGGGVAVEVHGRVDRVGRCEKRVAIADYKTGGRIDHRVNVTRLLKGDYLQVPLYEALGEPTTTSVELLGVGPHFDPEITEESDRRVVFGGFEAAESEGFRETLRVLVALATSGIHPLRDGHHCGYCDYRSACARAHPPSKERVEQAVDHRDFFDVRGKSARKPLLRDVRAKAGRST
jgi:hypothetical protein